MNTKLKYLALVGFLAIGGCQLSGAKITQQTELPAGDANAQQVTQALLLAEKPVKKSTQAEDNTEPAKVPAGTAMQHNSGTISLRLTDQ